MIPMIMSNKIDSDDSNNIYDEYNKMCNNCAKDEYNEIKHKKETKKNAINTNQTETNAKKER